MAKYVVEEEWVAKWVTMSWLLGSLASMPPRLRLSRSLRKQNTWSIAIAEAGSPHCGLAG